MSGKHGAGKGSRYRPVDQDKYAENYEAIFGKRKNNNGKKRTRPSSGKPNQSGKAENGKEIPNEE